MLAVRLDGFTASHRPGRGHHGLGHVVRERPLPGFGAARRRRSTLALLALASGPGWKNCGYSAWNVARSVAVACGERTVSVMRSPVASVASRAEICVSRLANADSSDCTVAAMSSSSSSAVCVELLLI